MSEHRRVSICNGFNVNGTVKWVEVESRTTPNDYYEHLISNFKTRSKIPFLNSFFKYKSLKFFRKRKKCIDIVFLRAKKKINALQFYNCSYSPLTYVFRVEQHLECQTCIEFSNKKNFTLLRAFVLQHNGQYCGMILLKQKNVSVVILSQFWTKFTITF